MLKIILIKKTPSLKYFSKIFASYVGVELPIDYLKRGSTYLFYNKDKLVGGYSIICQPPFRFIQLLPKEIKDSNSFFMEHSLNELYEINGLFIKDPTFKVKIFKNLLKKSLSLKKKYLLIFYNINNRKIHNTWQKRLNPTKVYIGKPNTSDGLLTSHENIFFGYIEQKNLKDSLNNLV